MSTRNAIEGGPLLDGLNPPQREAVLQTQGPVLILPLCGELTIGGLAAQPGSCVLASGLAEIAASGGVYWLAAQPCG